MTSLNIPDDLKISFHLLKNCKLWVWDFDDTLIDSTTYLKANMNPKAIVKRTNDELDIQVPQWRYFKRLIEFLVMHGCYVAIASFGTYEIIQAYMNRIMGFNQRYFTKKNIIAPCMADREVYTYTIPPNKNEYIYLLMQAFRIQDFKRVVLFDDLCSNVADALGIGIVAVQIATPRNGDSGNELYFGPWVMTTFDNTIMNDCGKEIYLNRTFTGVSNTDTDKHKIPYLANAFDKIDFGNSVQQAFEPIAFGSGIGSRKITVRPDIRWNKRNSGIASPTWKNGIWNSNISNSGSSSGNSGNSGSSSGKTTCGYNGNTLDMGIIGNRLYSNANVNANNGEIGESTLGGITSSFWDNKHSVPLPTGRNNWKSSGGSGGGGSGGGGSDNDDAYVYNNISQHNNDNKLPVNYMMGTIENFENTSSESRTDNNSSCNSCKKIKLDWITMSLLIIIVVMILVMIYHIKY